ncbi:MAG: hypothetical protein VKJ64_19185 [Leptolyngbyaceae bacterium]|nr:hypothetical protein [Leptolyngbyaceae bacterium]
MPLRDNSGRTIQLGEEIGRGGEGSVYTIQGDVANVAKVYHKAATGEKADKLKAMVANSFELPSFTSWPLSTLHDSSSSSIKGFTMPRIVGHKEVHELYGPRHRLTHFPSADWHFLVHAAKNIAAVFKTIHAQGHTIGDVNQSGILVSPKDARCRLIDTDSFQIRLGSKTYYCEVGTPHFTPPELQCQSFRGILRNDNHDNFGLAVIIFQLLFMGRHPFAGRYLGSGDMPIERAIREYRFAFSSNAAQKQMKQPPNTLNLSICSPAIAHLFEKAFSQSPSQAESRPTSQEWFKNLNLLLNKISTCSQNSAHKYYGGLSSCPWCELEESANIIYFITINSTNRKDLRNVDDLWIKIKGIKIPDQNNLPDPNTIVVRPTPLPEYAKPPRGLWGILDIFVGFHDDKGEKKKRQMQLQEKSRIWNDIEDEWYDLEYSADFNSLSQKLEKAYRRYKRIPKEYQLEYQTELKQLYLGHFLIDKAGISDIGKKRALILASYGVESAADISKKNVSSIPGFGPKLTARLIEWRDGLDQNFHKYRPSSKDKALLSRVDQKYVRRRDEIERQLTNGLKQLDHHRSVLVNEREVLLRKAREVAPQLAQARADMTVYS